MVVRRRGVQTAIVTFVAMSFMLPPIALAAEMGPSDPKERNLADFDFVTGTIAECYAGYDLKRTKYGPEALSQLTQALRVQASTATDAEMYSILKKWMDYWHDGHTGVAQVPATATPNEAPITPVRQLSEETVRSRLASLGKKRDPVEGIWRIANDYRVAVLREDKNPTRFDAIVLTTGLSSWTPGQIKAEITRKQDGTLSLLYRDSVHAEHEMGVKLTLSGAVIAPVLYPPWTREVPALADAASVRRELPTSELVLERVTAKTMWLRVPSFVESQAAPLRELLARHAFELSHTPNLIIDLRNNGGGSDLVYEPLVKLVYTHPIYEIGVEVRSCRRNIELRRQIAADLRKDLPQAADYLEAQAAKMAQHPGEYVMASSQPFSITTEKAVETFPSRVVILIDGAASTAEQFLLTARQSQKVTFLGQKNSAGVLDFANVVSEPVPSGRYRLQWAISRSLRLPDDPVDPDGFAPQVRIPAAVRDPVRYAADWLDHQSG